MFLCMSSFHPRKLVFSEIVSGINDLFRKFARPPANSDPYLLWFLEYMYVVPIARGDCYVKKTQYHNQIA